MHSVKLKDVFAPLQRTKQTVLGLGGGGRFHLPDQEFGQIAVLTSTSLRGSEHRDGGHCKFCPLEGRNVVLHLPQPCPWWGWGGWRAGWRLGGEGQLELSNLRAGKHWPGGERQVLIITIATQRACCGSQIYHFTWVEAHFTLVPGDKACNL